jgi:hypothetical protein
LRERARFVSCFDKNITRTLRQDNSFPRAQRRDPGPPAHTAQMQPAIPGQVFSNDRARTFGRLLQPEPLSATMDGGDNGSSLDGSLGPNRRFPLYQISP